MLGGWAVEDDDEAEDVEELPPRSRRTTTSPLSPYALVTATRGAWEAAVLACAFLARVAKEGY